MLDIGAFRSSGRQFSKFCERWAGVYIANISSQGNIISVLATASLLSCICGSAALDITLTPERSTLKVAMASTLNQPCY